MSISGRDINLDDVQALLGRALVDAAFRKELITDPEGAFTVLGYRMSDDSLKFFKALNDEAFLAGAQAVEDRLGGRPVIAAWL